MDNDNGKIPSDSHEYHHTLVSQTYNIKIPNLLLELT